MPDGTAARAAATSTCESLAILKEKLLEFYFEQLLERPKPANRRDHSWAKNLEVVREACEHRLKSLNTVDEVLQFGSRCIKNTSLREAFIWHGCEAVWEAAVPWHLQESAVQPAAEHPNFERDIALFEQSLSEERPTKFQRCLRLADDPFELEPNPESVSEPSAKRRSFEGRLCPAEEPIDLTSESEAEHHGGTGASAAR